MLFRLDGHKFIFVGLAVPADVYFKLTMTAEVNDTEIRGIQNTIVVSVFI